MSFISAAAADQNTYRVWQRPDPSGGAAQRYLVKEDGSVAYLVDPGINGTHKVRPDGTSVDKFVAPKATLMSYIIKGILDRKLPWALVLFGVMISLVLELSGIPSLAFAVGVYLPISASMPVFAGGIVRWLVDRRMRHNLRQHNLDEAKKRIPPPKPQAYRDPAFFLHHFDDPAVKENAGALATPIPP